MKFFSKMSRRERYSVMAALVIVVLYLVIEFGIVPFLNWRRNLTVSLKTKAQTLEQIRSMKNEYEQLKQKSKISETYFSARPQGFTLFSFLDDLASKNGLKDNIAYMKPSKNKPKDSPYTISMVEVKLQGITLKQLTPYLHMVETSKNMIFVRRTSITKNTNEATIDVILQVETYEA
jgi:general secretion pathway protein M